MIMTNKKLLLSTSLLMAWTGLSAQTDVTSRITNPSFETNGTQGWVQSGLKAQTNNAFTLKSGTTYLEKWTGKGNKVGSCSISQTVRDLTPGKYRLTVAAQNIQENTPTEGQTGSYIYGGDQQTTVSVRDDYSVEFDIQTDSTSIGFVAKDATGN